MKLGIHDPQSLLTLKRTGSHVPQLEPDQAFLHTQLHAPGDVPVTLDARLLQSLKLVHCRLQFG
jgi:hypothetical protein